MRVEYDEAGQYEEKIDAEESLCQCGHQPVGNWLGECAGSEASVAYRDAQRGQASANLQQQHAIPPIGCHIGKGRPDRWQSILSRDFYTMRLWIGPQRAYQLSS